jgi:PilZ domain
VDVLADPFSTLLGRSVDLSEGGLRGVLPVTGLDAGTRVIVRVPLDGVPTVFEGVVQRSRRPSHRARVAGWHSDVALAFDDPEAHGGALRAAVITMQRRARRLAPPGSR